MYPRGTRQRVPVHQWSNKEIHTKQRLVRREARKILAIWGLDEGYLPDAEQSAWEAALARSWPDDPHLPLVCQDGARIFASYWTRGVHPTATRRHLRYPGRIDEAVLEPAHEGNPEPTAILRDLIRRVDAGSDREMRDLWQAQVLHHSRRLTGIPSVSMAETKAMGWTPSRVSRTRERLLRLAREVCAA